jgi:RNA polymerase sigma factor (sigma-70 family)
MGIESGSNPRDILRVQHAPLNDPAPVHGSKECLKGRNEFGESSKRVGQGSECAASRLASRRGDGSLSVVIDLMSRATTVDASDEAADAPDRKAFVTTQWSVVLAAGGRDTDCARTALEQLCRDYWMPLYGYVRRVGHSREEAEDLTQGFFARLLERKMVSRADPARGRFRSFLLGSLKHFLAHEWEKARALKRGGHARRIPLAFDTAETGCAQPIDPGDSPDRAYDRQWALTLLDVVLTRLRKEYADSGRAPLFLALKETLSGDRGDLSHRDLGVRLGLSQGAIKVAAHRLRRRYRELLRNEIARTLDGAESVEEELRHLFGALAG